MEYPASLTDTHAHLKKQGLDELLQRAKQNQVTKIIAVGSDLTSSKEAVKIAKKYHGIWAAVGIHPHEASKVKSGCLIEIEELAKEKEVVAIGEAGLDYHYQNSEKQEQKSLFIKQICLANAAKKPLIIHSREAMDDTLKIIEEFLPERAVFHCFSGNLEVANKLIDKGFYISISGVVTFKNAGSLVGVIKELPLERLLLETDAPYLSPEPFRGKENEPANMLYTARKVAQIKGVSLEELAQATTSNAERLFNI